MPAPGCAVGAAAVPLDGRTSENALDASAEPRRRLTLALPDRLEHCQHVIGFNLIDRHFTDDGISVVHKRLPPLITVSLTSETLESIGHIAFRHFLKGGRRIPLRCRRDNCLRARMLDRINPVIYQRACALALSRALTRLTSARAPSPISRVRPFSLN